MTTHAKTMTAADWGGPRAKVLARYEGKNEFIQGDVAVAIGALYAGCDFFGAYPITPASEIAETLANLMPEVDGRFVQFEDELASVSAIIGAAWAGARSMTATSGPGFSLMMENIGYALMTETPTVLVDVQRSGPSTGQATLPAQGDFYQARWGTHGDHEAIALSPWSCQECFDLTIEAFNLAERFRMPVMLLSDGEIGHSRERVAFPKAADVPIVRRELASSLDQQVFGGRPVPPMGRFGDGLALHVTGSTHTETGMRKPTVPHIHDAQIRRMTSKVADARDELTRLDTVLTGGEDVLVVAHGVSARPAFGAVEQLRAQGEKVGLIRLIGLWPFPGPKLAELCADAKAVVVPEMNLGQMSRELERFVDCPVVGLNQIGGEVFHVRQIAEAALAARRQA